jgi:hypothetical protein
VEHAAAKRLFARAARRPVVVAPDLADRIEVLLARRCGETLGLARRAGLAVAGFERVSEALRHDRVALLVFALDGGKNSRCKIGALGHGIPWAAALSADELGAAFGRDRAAHVSIGPGPLCSRLLRDLDRLAGFRGGAVTNRELDFAPSAEHQNGGNGSNG